MEYNEYTVQETWGRFHSLYIITSSKNGWTGSVSGTFNSEKKAQAHLDKLIEEEKKEMINEL